MSEVVVVIGPGQIGQAIARRVGFGKHVLVADKRQENANAAAEVLGNAGYDVSVATVDVSSRKDVDALVQTATDWVMSPVWSTPPVFHHLRRRWLPFSELICTAPH